MDRNGKLQGWYASGIISFGMILECLVEIVYYDFIDFGRLL